MNWVFAKRPFPHGQVTTSYILYIILYISGASGSSVIIMKGCFILFFQQLNIKHPAEFERDAAWYVFHAKIALQTFDYNSAKINKCVLIVLQSRASLKTISTVHTQQLTLQLYGTQSASLLGRSASNAGYLTITGNVFTAECLAASRPLFHSLSSPSSRL